MKRRINNTIFFLLLVCCLQAQERGVGELFRDLRSHPKEDTIRAVLLDDLAWSYSMFNPDSSILFCHQALALCRKIHYAEGEASVLNTLGVNYRNLAMYDSAFFYFEKALNKRKAQKKQDKVIAVLLNTANVYNQLKDYSNSILKYKEVIRLAHEIKNKKAEMTAQVNLADVYRDIGSYDKGMACLNIARQINKEINDTLQAPYMYAVLSQLQQGMGDPAAAIATERLALKLLGSRPDVYLKISVLSNMGSAFRQINQTDSALHTYLVAEKLMNDVHDSIGLGIVSGNIAKVHIAGNNPSAALVYALKAIEIGKNIRDTTLYSDNMINVARVYALKNDFKTALSYATEALPLIEKFNNKMMLSAAYACLADIYKGLNQHDKRADYLEKSFACRDSAMSEENKRTATRLNVELNVFGKEKEIELLNKSAEVKEAELEKQKTARRLITGIAALFALIVVIVVFFFVKLRKSNLIIQKQKERVESQNEIISVQKQTVEEKQKEIIDSINYAKRIQSAVLTSNEVWSRVSKDHFVFFRPKDIVSGDFYWAYNTPNNRSVFALADCTGHGVPGGFMSMLGNSFLNEIVVENKIFSAATILNKLREKIINALDQQGEEKRRDGMDITLCVWNKLNNSLEFAGANNPLFILRNGAFTELKPDKNANRFIRWRRQSVFVSNASA